MNELDKLAILYGTDKSSLTHNYCVKYEKYLPFKRDDKLKILEIGVLNGESIRMWKHYFHNSEIIGIDINSKCKETEEERINIQIGDQTDINFLKKVIEKHGPFDMILDDGSHINSHVIITFEILFPSVKSNGVYIVEDSCTSYWNEFGGGELKIGSTIEYFKKYIDDVNFHGLRAWNTNNINIRKEDVLVDLFNKQYPLGKNNIESINFLNSIILITKR